MEDCNITSAPFGKEQNRINTYDSAIKQLVHILKTKASDNLKQLEDLWDTINSANVPLPEITENEKIRTSPSLSRSSPSPLNSMSDNSNDSTSSINTSLKRGHSKIIHTQSTNSQIKKPKLNNAVPISKVNKPVIMKTNNNLDMLDDFTCAICRNFNQDLNNKLVECRKCSNLYHQLCHVPKIKNEEIDDKDFEECANCKILESSDDEVQTINSKAIVTSSEISSQKIKLKKEQNINGSPDEIKNRTDSKGFLGLATKLNVKPNSPTEHTEKSKPSNELFGLNKKKPTVQSTNKATKQILDKKSGLFNLSNGLNSQKKAMFGNLKDKKVLNGPGLIQNPPSISVAGRSKIS